MSDYSVLAPITFIGILMAIVGFYAKYREARETKAAESTKVSFELGDSQSNRLRQEADRLGIQPSDLARAALTDLLEGRDEDVRAAVARVLQKKVDLYKRPA